MTEKEHEKSLFDDLIPVDDVISEEEEIVEDDSTEENQEEESDESEQELAEDEDPRVAALYELMTSNEIIPTQEGFKATLEGLQEVLENLPEHYFMQAAETLHPEAQELAKYMFQLGDKADMNALKSFFTSYIQQDVDVEDEDQAYSYLKSKLQSAKVFPNEEKLNKYLDDLKEDNSLTDTAKQLYEEEKEKKEQEKLAIIEQTKQERIQQEQQAKEYFRNLYAEIDAQPWKPERKNLIKENLKPDVVALKNQIIMSNPRLMVQLADIYARLDVDKKEFDLSDLQLKAESKKTVEKKDNLKQKKVDSILSRIQTGKANADTRNGTSFWSNFEKTD